MAEGAFSVLDGNTFIVGDRRGDVRPEGGRDHGFFSADTRFISRWVLRVDGASLDLLGIDQDAHFAAQFFLTPIIAAEFTAPCSVMRRRCVDRVWIEEITVVNHREPLKSIPTSPTCSRSKTRSSPSERLSGARRRERWCSTTSTGSSGGP
jgi:hypothetical protein